MQTTNLLTRGDTFFGVCQGLGEDLRIHPNILRLALAALVFFNPVLAIAAYAAGGAIVALSRWLVPNPAPAAVAELTPQPAETVKAEADADPVPLAA